MTRAILAILAALLLADKAAAQMPQCADHATVAAELAERYGETRRAMGLAASGAVMEVYASEMGTWTITGTTPGGLTCLVAAGEGFDATALALPPKGDPA